MLTIFKISQDKDVCYNTLCGLCKKKTLCICLQCEISLALTPESLNDNRTKWTFAEANWGSSTQAQSYSSALKAMLELNRVEEHVKNFRPQVLVLTGMPGSRPPLVDFANLITKGLSLLVCAHILKVSNG
jgi:hypothetical protein